MIFIARTKQNKNRLVPKTMGRQKRATGSVLRGETKHDLAASYFSLFDLSFCVYEA